MRAQGRPTCRDTLIPVPDVAQRAVPLRCTSAAYLMRPRLVLAKSRTTKARPSRSNRPSRLCIAHKARSSECFFPPLTARRQHPRLSHLHAPKESSIMLLRHAGFEALYVSISGPTHHTFAQIMDDVSLRVWVSCSWLRKQSLVIESNEAAPTPISRLQNFLCYNVSAKFPPRSCYTPILQRFRSSRGVMYHTYCTTGKTDLIVRSQSKIPFIVSSLLVTTLSPSSLYQPFLCFRCTITLLLA